MGEIMSRNARKATVLPPCKFAAMLVRLICGDVWPGARLTGGDSTIWLGVVMTPPGSATAVNTSRTLNVAGASPLFSTVPTATAVALVAIPHPFQALM